jgi:glyoxylase-like metal-dependent hydrolase (beta-lactamase superfamily II)
VPSSSTTLRYGVHVAAAKPATSNALPPGESELWWPETSSTLIYGDTDAVLVDPLMTVQESTALADWVAATGKNLTAIYVTHAHADHQYGGSVLLDRFPGARLVAVPAVAAAMAEQQSAAVREGFWEGFFPGQLPDRLAAAEALDGDFELEGHALVPVEVGHTDTDDSTCLHVPSIGLVVAGDAVYSGIHPALLESGPAGRRAWLAALDLVESLAPRYVVAGHRRRHSTDSPDDIEATRRYLRDFELEVARTGTAGQLYGAMLARYPDRAYPAALWFSAGAAKPGPAQN